MTDFPANTAAGAYPPAPAELGAGALSARLEALIGNETVSAVARKCGRAESVLVTYLNQLVRDGVPVDKASIQGASMRLRAVLMTAITTALGLIPLLVSSGTGSEVQRPLATVVIGGLFTSTVLTLLVIPALYKWFSIQVTKDA